VRRDPQSSILTNKNMDFQSGVFYFFAAILLFAALRVITARNPVHSALFLVLAFVTAAALWMLLEAEFLAIVLVLVYVGAVMVLFLFVVMMLDINLDRLREGYWDYLVPALIVAGVMVAEMAIILGGRYFGRGPQQYGRTRPADLHLLRLSLRDRCGDPAGRHRRRHRADAAQPQGHQVPEPLAADQGPQPRPGARDCDAV
jgi:NADH:ubiquinone oxidoreductase subunit 6 (subunit J)